MSYLRSCYTTPMRFDLANPSELRTVRWYFTEPGAPVLDAVSPFRSRVQSNMIADDGTLGEVGGAGRAWSNGATPSPYPVGATCWPDSGFSTGITIGGTYPIAASGVKQCCYPAPCLGTPAPPGPVPAVDGNGPLGLSQPFAGLDLYESSPTPPTVFPWYQWYCAAGPAPAQKLLGAYSSSLFIEDCPLVSYDLSLRTYTYAGGPHFPAGWTITIGPFP